MSFNKDALKQLAKATITNVSDESKLLLFGSITYYISHWIDASNLRRFLIIATNYGGFLENRI